MNDEAYIAHIREQFRSASVLADWEMQECGMCKTMIMLPWELCIDCSDFLEKKENEAREKAG